MQETVVMGNSLVEGPIPLSGAGFVAKENGNFQPGEYKRLCNLEINKDGILANRRNVYSVFGENTGSAITPITNAQRFLGNMGEYTLLTDGVNQFLVGEGTYAELWNTFSGPTVAPSFSRFLGFFRYNNRNYWLVLEFSSGASIALALYYDAAIPVPDVPATYGAGYQTSLTREVILSFAAGTTDFYQFQFRNFFLYKERLWIATSIGLYFSAATDPTDFVVPNGGFFKFPGNVVNWAFAIKDNVYTLCEDAVYSLTYATDPNMDSTVRPLSDTIGGEMGCIHLDTPYFINNQGIFSINGNNIDKVMDNQFDYGKDAYRNRILSFEEYLVVNKYTPVNYDNNYSPPSTAANRKNLWRSPESDTVGGTQIDDGWTSVASTATETRENLLLNPGCENADWTIDWSGGGIGFGLGTDAGLKKSGSRSSKFHSAAGAPGSPVTVHIEMPSRACLPSKPYAVSLYFRSTLFRSIRMEVAYYTSGMSLIQQFVSYTSCPANVWTRVSRVTTSPSNAAFIRVRFIKESITDNIYTNFDEGLLEQSSTVNDFFSGSSTDTTFNEYSWQGAANNSKSTHTLKYSVVNAPTNIADGQPGKVLYLEGTSADADYFVGAPDPGNAWASCSYTLTPTTPIVYGIPYTFHFQYRRWGVVSFPTSTTLQYKIDYLDAGAVSVGSSTGTVNYPLGTSSSYKTFTLGGIVFPATAVSFKITFTFYLEPYAGTEITWQLYFNKFLLEKTSTYSGYFTGATPDTADIVYNWDGVAYASESSTVSATTHAYLKNNGSKFDPFLEGNSLGYNTYFINTDNGATHVLDFTDQYAGYGQGEAGFLSDAFINPYDDDSGNYKLFFLTNKMISDTDYKAFVYYISSSEDNEVNDFAASLTNVLVRRAPRIDVEIDSFVPDGHEYRIKKFRSLLVQGVFPSSGIQIEAYYDNSGTALEYPVLVNEASYSAPRRHYPFRFGLNQRARSITLRLRNLLWPDEIMEPFGSVEVSDMRVMWTPTQKLPS